MDRGFLPDLPKVRQPLRGADIVQRAGGHEAVQPLCHEWREQISLERPWALRGEKRLDGKVKNAGITKQQKSKSK